ncbi:MAG TPA: segregation/condensation protein A [Clostridia bacterium]|jgi:segregation and condensation protein A|nr:segregation/condensation protein A [Clostridia bacterium]HOL60759.1 segregation/condensation protein A [Clostridia bacterium]HPO53334.1 segregation/condensation protein A [Clostridia bacterium]
MSFGTEESFDVTVDLFEDPVPIEVLLEMCKKGKVDIRDIFVSDITEQYIKYVAELESKNYDNISSFILLASTLLELKSNSLLPKPEEIAEDTLSEQERFFLKMEEYKLYMEQSEKLREREILNRFYRDPVFAEDDYKVVIKNFDLNKLIAAFSSLLEKREFEETQEEPKKIEKERFTVAEKIVDLIEYIRAYKVVNFFSLFEPDYTKLEIINTFLALLEILKRQIAAAEQSGFCSDITIRYTPLTDNFDTNAEEELLSDANGYN